MSLCYYNKDYGSCRFYNFFEVSIEMSATMMSSILLFVMGTIFWSTSVSLAMPGAFSEVPVTDEGVIAAANFAVEAVSANTLNDDPQTAPVRMKLLKILGAQQQVVSGVNYRMRLAVVVDGEEKVAETVVWWQAWRKPTPYAVTSWHWLETDKQN